MRLHHKFMWAMLVELGTNFWYEEDDLHTQEGNNLWQIPGSHKLRFNRETWNKYIDDLKDAGVNTLVIDLGDAVQYKSHPEIAVEGAFTVEELTAELDRLNDMGFEVIPKLNFSTTHDYWLGKYARMVSTPEYYKVCSDLIDEACKLFDARFLHIGFDEEGYEMQATYNYVVIRQHELWWHDLYYFVECVERNGAKACMWSDYARHRPDEFVEKCPKSVVQCNWYYFTEFGDDVDEMRKIRIAPFHIFEKEGYYQFPCGSSCYYEDCFPNLVEYCSKNIPAEHLVGFLQTCWDYPTPEYLPELKRSVDSFRAARERVGDFPKEK